MIDIDRVHDVLSGKLRGRGVGSTTAQLIRLAGMVDFCPGKNICYIASTSKEIEYITKYAFPDVLEYMNMLEDVEIIRRDFYLFKNRCRIIFVAADKRTIHNRMRGFRIENIVVDDSAMDRLDQDDIDFINITLV